MAQTGDSGGTALCVARQVRVQTWATVGHRRTHASLATSRCRQIRRRSRRSQTLRRQDAFRPAERRGRVAARRGLRGLRDLAGMGSGRGRRRRAAGGVTGFGGAPGSACR